MERLPSEHVGLLLVFIGGTCYGPVVLIDIETNTNPTSMAGVVCRAADQKHKQRTFAVICFSDHIGHLSLTQTSPTKDRRKCTPRLHYLRLGNFITRRNKWRPFTTIHPMLWEGRENTPCIIQWILLFFSMLTIKTHVHLSLAYPQKMSPGAGIQLLFFIE